MIADKRREKLIKIVKEALKPVSGSRLAELLCVSRQVIVQDIALLRAGGEDIFATPQGYIYTTSLKSRPRKVFAVRHNPEQIKDELQTVIDNGGKVLDVIVEHPLYGELKGMLMIASPTDLQDFMAKYRKTGAEPLLALTRGIHLHTVEADDEESLSRIGQELQKKGFLLDEV